MHALFAKHAQPITNAIALKAVNIADTNADLMYYISVSTCFMQNTSAQTINAEIGPPPSSCRRTHCSWPYAKLSLRAGLLTYCND